MILVKSVEIEKRKSLSNREYEIYTVFYLYQVLPNLTKEVRSPAEAKDFSSILCVHISSWAHPVSCTVGTGGPFPGVKARPGPDADHSTPSSSEAVNE
jgi:hypothetical protein